MKIGIFYGSTTGTTAEVAGKIAKVMGVASADVHNVAETAPSRLGDYDLNLVGSSTWGSGEVQDDMASFLDGVKALSLKGKTVAVFGCGDDTMRDTFCNAVGEIYRTFKDTGARMIGDFNALGYDYEHTGAQIDDKIVGLVLDENNHSDLTDRRIAEWSSKVESQYGE